MELVICVTVQDFYIENTPPISKFFKDLKLANDYYNECLEVDKKSGGMQKTSIQLCQVVISF